MNDKSNKFCFASIDVEQDFAAIDNREYKGVENLQEILNIFERYSIPTTLFVTGETIEKYPVLIKQWSNNYEIACHGFTHRFWNDLSIKDREREVEKFKKIYQNVSQKSVKGFRAPSHIIDEQGMKLLQNKGFLYDSSIVPHYPFIKKYRGYKKKAPMEPYHLSFDDCWRKGNSEILEIPVAGQIFGIPLAGAWIARIPFWFYKILFEIESPNFITLSIHSWDRLKTSRNFYFNFPRKLDKLLKLLKSKNYKFLKGYEFCKN
jgi:hypothetical protein